MKFKIGDLVSSYRSRRFGGKLIPHSTSPCRGLILFISSDNWCRIYWFELKEIINEHINWIEKA